MKDASDIEAWKKKRHDFETMIGHVQKLADVKDGKSASHRVLARLQHEYKKMELEAMPSPPVEWRSLRVSNKEQS